MEAAIPTSLITPKIVFIGTEDPKAHLTTFNAHMMITGGTNAMHCRIFVGNGLLASQMAISPFSINFLDCSGSNSSSTKLSRLSLSTSSV